MTKLKLGDGIKALISKINANFGEVEGKKVVLYDGSVNIPSVDSGGSVNITLSADCTKFDGLIFQRAECMADTSYIPPVVGLIYKPLSHMADYTYMFEGMNLFAMNAEIVNKTTIKLSGNAYSGINIGSTPPAARYIDSFEDLPLLKVIGFKI